MTFNPGLTVSRYFNTKLGDDFTLKIVESQSVRGVSSEMNWCLVSLLLSAAISATEGRVAGVYLCRRYLFNSHTNWSGAWVNSYVLFSSSDRSSATTFGNLCSVGQWGHAGFTQEFIPV